ncbi:unnamed protein product [Mycena citricolor]|uniref:Protein kinase domain-containing protein n=1 Tax=Mycena citricolor TaxID=2018698 RepID=A0AAD2Q6F0_9AGAR|nr:unnamed protein product [Mycena citricolor]
MWMEECKAHWRGVISTDAMLDSMPKATTEDDACIAKMVELGQSALDRARQSRDELDAINAAIHPRPRKNGDKRKARKRNEQSLVKTMTTYFADITQNFDDAHKPYFRDSHAELIPCVDDPEEHDLAPELCGTRPGIAADHRLTWREIGFVAEIKDNLHIIVKRTGLDKRARDQQTDPDDKDCNEDEDGSKDDEDGDVDHGDTDPAEYRLTQGKEGSEAYVQLAKSARNMLLASGGLYVYLLFIVGRAAHIVRYDRSGWTATPPIYWSEEKTILPRFLLRLYNPPEGPQNSPGRMLGDDFTISPLTEKEKMALQAALDRKENSYASDLAQVDGDLTERSVSMIAVQFVDGSDGGRQHQLVHCFTFGQPLWVSHGLFGRATKVIRVVLECDLNSDNPTIYALKDSWREGCRRPEVDYYDVVDDYRRKNAEFVSGLGPSKSVAKCHGSIDLSLTLANSAPRTSAKWDCGSHRTTSVSHLGERARDLIRYHTRSLLTPIGVRAERFKCVRDVVSIVFEGLMDAWIADLAGVRHRDISDGNVMVDKVLRSGFLLDYDYAEFSPEGLAAFAELSKDRARQDDHLYQNIDKSLKEITGTPPFLALELAFDRGVAHGAHHDIESFYWLLIWIILRHTPPEFHGHSPYKFAELFGFHSPDKKNTWITRSECIGPPNSPLRSLTLQWVLEVKEQNRVVAPTLKQLSPSLADDTDSSGEESDSAPVEPEKPPKKMAFRSVYKFIKKRLAVKGWDAMPHDHWVEYIPPSSHKTTAIRQHDARALKAL